MLRPENGSKFLSGMKLKVNIPKDWRKKKKKENGGEREKTNTERKICMSLHIYSLLDPSST